MKKFGIAIILILMLVTICIFAFTGNKKNENTTTNTNVVENEQKNETQNEQLNETIENKIENEIQNETSNEVENTVPSENSGEDPKTEEEKATSIVKKDWGEDNNVEISIDGIDSNGNYIVAVRNSKTTEALAFYTVNVRNNTFTKKEMN